MKERFYKFYNRTGHTSDTTVVHSINIQDPISEIVLQYETVASQKEMTAHPMAAITKVEIVDGSDVLLSLDGYELQARDWYHNGGQLRGGWNAFLNGMTSVHVVGIPFGRYLFDKMYALDPRRFVNPQIRVSIDIDAGGNAPATVYLSMWARLFDEPLGSLKGYLMAKEIKQYTMSDGTHEYTDLPLDYPYRNIFFRAFLAGTESNQCIQNIKLSEDQDKRIPFDGPASKVLLPILVTLPPIEEHYYINVGTSTRYIYCTPTTRVLAVGAPWKATAEANTAAFYDGDGGKLKMIKSSAESNTQVYVRGSVPHAVFPLPLGVDDDNEEWYDVVGLGSLRLDIEGEKASEGYLFVEQVRHY